jgi:putative ABC transport system permease protein
VLAIGDGALSGAPAKDWPAVRTVVREQLPDVTQTEILGLRDGHGRQAVRFAVPGRTNYSFGYAARFRASTLVGAEALSLTPLAGDALARARSVLERGGAVVMTNEPVSATTVRVRAEHAPAVEVPAVYVDYGTYGMAPMLGVVSPALAHRLGQSTRLVGLHLHGAYITSGEQDRLTQALGVLSRPPDIYVEHGYQVDGTEKVVLWILFGLAGILMLGGTLTATFLALSDARSDLATLSAVGASPRMRRGVAAAYAVSVGLVGALLGAAVGFIPGVAVSYPLTRDFTGEGPSHYLSIPWLEIVGLVVLLPVLTALVVGLLARSRLPLVARLD